jgi:hypothetical protein
MRKLLACLVAALAMAAGGAQAALAFHGSHEFIATGRGTTDVSSDNTTNLSQCIFFPFFQCVTISTRIQETTRETFSFSARQQETVGTIVAEPHGSMTIDFALSRTTTVTVSDPFNLCGVFFFCPTPSTTTLNQNAKASADVTCLRVVNNRAVLGGRVSRFAGDFVPTRGLLFNATDNTIAGTQVAPDQFASAFIAEAPQVCPFPSADKPIQSGDVTVRQT